MLLYLVVFEDNPCELVDRGKIFTEVQKAKDVAESYQVLNPDRGVIVIIEQVIINPLKL